jgi:hypothetical protein
MHNGLGINTKLLIMNTDSKNTEPKQCTIPSVSGSITVYKPKNDRNRKIYCKSEWFNDVEYFEFIEEESFLLIRKCLLEIPKKAIKMPKSRCFDMVSELPIGTFSVDDEESTEDELVIYYR